MGRDGCRELVSVGVAPVSVMLGWRKEEEEGKDERKTEREKGGSSAPAYTVR